MTEPIIVSLITGACAIIGSFVGQTISAARQTSKLIDEIKHNSEISDAEIKGDIAVIKTEIVDLRKEVEKHNKVIERTYKLEQKVEDFEKAYGK